MPQVVDTVELWHAKAQRKLALRFLAGFLLRRHIQEDTHDSIEDARTALEVDRSRALCLSFSGMALRPAASSFAPRPQVYRAHAQLARADALDATRMTLYEFGHRVGWRLDHDDMRALVAARREREADAAREAEADKEAAAARGE